MADAKNHILLKIYQQLQTPGLANELATQLSGSELNSLLLEIFRLRAGTINPADLLKAYRQNRFVQPAAIDTIRHRQLELEWLQAAALKGFTPVTLAPLAPLGACSAFGAVHQDKVLSSIRGTEVLADATNVLALQIALDCKKDADKNKIIHYCTAGCHVRGQHFSQPGSTAHFSVFCLASGGFDRGDFVFEQEQLQLHTGLLLHLTRHSFPEAALSIRFNLSTAAERLINFLSQPGQPWSGLPCHIETGIKNNYYQFLQFKIFAGLNGQEINIADGGFTNWTQQLTGNRKHRLLISGAGLELMGKLLTG